MKVKTDNSDGLNELRSQGFYAKRQTLTLMGYRTPTCQGPRQKQKKKKLKRRKEREIREEKCV